MLLMLIVSGIVYINIVGLIETADWVKHTHAVIADARELEKLIVDMETGVRGFLITDNEIFLDPFKEAQKVLDKKIIKLKKSVSDNSEQIVRLETIDGIVRQWVKSVARPEIAARIESNKNGVAMNNVIYMVNSKMGKNIIDRLRVKLDTFIKVETSLLEIRELESKNAATKTTLIIIAATMLAIFLVLFSALHVSNLISGGLKVLVERTREISSGNLTSKIRIKDDDEIGKLASAFNDMSQQLSDRENTLRQSKERLIKEVDERKKTTDYLETIIETSLSGILVTNSKGNISRANDAYLNMIGYETGEIIGKHTIELSPREAGLYESSTGEKIQVGEAFLNSSREMVENLLEQGKVQKYEGYALRKDGKIIFTEENNVLIYNQQKEIIAAVSNIQDITDRKQLEDNLRQSQKMEAIGTLAGGIAHDFNNILGGIIGYTELSKDDTPLNSPVDDYLNNVLKLTRRASDLVAQILTFSRIDLDKEYPIDIAPVLKEALKLLHSTLPRTIEIEKHIDESSAVVIGDQSSIQQIMMNLITNAVQSMKEDKGIIKITLTSERLDEKDLSGNSNANPGIFVKLSVQDNGSGIDPSVLTHIFDPFYTTKDVGKGTGLGLSVVHGIVTAHGGLIKVNSVLNEGSTFNIFLPKTEMEAIETDAVSPQAIHGNANIMFVDDEEVLTNIAQRSLSSLGYTITVACSASEAIEIFKKNPEQFDLVITDLSMPEMNGIDLSKRLQELRPEIPVILCSGNKENVTDQSIKDAGIRKVVRKPILKAELSKVIFDVLNLKEK